MRIYRALVIAFLVIFVLSIGIGMILFGLRTQ